MRHDIRVDNSLGRRHQARAINALLLERPRLAGIRKPGKDTAPGKVVPQPHNERPRALVGAHRS